MAKRTSEMSVTTQNRRRKRCGRWGRGQLKSPPPNSRETYLQVRDPTVKQNESIRRGDVHLRSPADNAPSNPRLGIRRPHPIPHLPFKTKGSPGLCPREPWRSGISLERFPRRRVSRAWGRAGDAGRAPRIPASASCFLPLVEYRARPQPLAFLHCASPARTHRDPCREALCPVRESGRSTSALGLGFAGPGGIRWVVSGNEGPGRKSAAGDASWAGHIHLECPQTRAAAPPPRSAGRRAIRRLYTSGAQERRGKAGGVGGAPGRGDQAAELHPGKCSCFPKHYQYRAQVGTARGAQQLSSPAPFLRGQG